MPRVKACNASKIKSVLHGFPGEFTKTPNNELYCNLCNCVVSCDKRFLVDSHRKTSKHQKSLSRSELQMPQSSQTFLRSSNSDFVEKVTKGFLSANIPLYKLNNKHVKNLFSDIGHSLPAESTCRKNSAEIRCR